MARRWRDPRDGTLWLIDVMPFDFGPAPEADRPTLIGWTLIFASPSGSRRLPVGYELGADLSGLRDAELTSLLDAAALRE